MQALLAIFAIVASIALAGNSDAAQPAQADSAPLKGVTIAVDPGHNGGNAAHPEEINKLVPAGGFEKECDTTGTQTSDGALTEPAFTWDVSKRLKKLLEAKGAKVVLTRSNNTGVGPCINERAAIGNKAKADVAISIHGDGAAARDHGFHVIRPGLVRGYTENIVKPSKAEATDVRDALVDAGLVTSNYRGRNGIDRRTDLGGLNLSKVPKVLVELGNMENAHDAGQMKRKAWRQRIARALRSGLTEFLGR